jgi:hypothetical protein
MTDLKSVLLAKDYNMCRESSGRDEYVNYKIDRKASRSGRSTNTEYVSIVDTKYK